MDEDDITPPVRRRLNMRRERMGGGFSESTSTHLETYRAGDADGNIGDEPDRAIDPLNGMDEREFVERNGPPQLPPPGDDGTSGRENPRQRLNQVAMSGSATYTKEYRLRLLHRLLMRNVSLDQIAQQMQVSIKTVERDRAELKRFLRENAEALHINEIVGQQSGVYDEIAGMALRMASTAETPTPMKLAAMRTALAANADRTRLYNTAGVFDVLRFRPPADAATASDIQQLMQHTEDALSRILAESDEEDEEPTPRRHIRRKRGSFAKMTFDDTNASGSDNEVDII